MLKKIKLLKYLKLIVLIIFTILLYSCQNSTSSIQLPSSDYTNFDMKKSKIDYLIQVHQLTDSTFQIIYRDTLVASLDSTLHPKVLNLKQKNQRLHEYPELLLSLDKDLSYTKFKLLALEFRKLLFQRYILKLDNGEHLSTYQFPIQKEENVYLDSRIKGQEVPPFFKEFKPYFEQGNYLFFSLKNKAIHIKDPNGASISDYTSYALTHKQFIIFYELDQRATYQDYIYLISNMMRRQERIRETIEKNKGLSNQDRMENYKFILLNHNYLPYFKDYNL